MKPMLRQVNRLLLLIALAVVGTYAFLCGWMYSNARFLPILAEVRECPVMRTNKMGGAA
jgi:hypothetical protein